MTNKIYLAGVKIDNVDGHDIIQRVKELINKNKKGYFAYVNAHAVNLAQDMEWFRNFLNQSEISYADGQGIRIGAWLLGKKIPPLVNLTRWSWELFHFASENNYSIFVFGAKEDILKKAIENMKKKFPKLKIAGYHHGYFDNSNSHKIVQYISEVKPNILIVGMGMPLQEKWIIENFDFLDVNAIFNAGSCIDIIAGHKKVCPDWMTNVGLEWLFRFVREPKRLFKRYIFGNPKFIYKILTKR